MNDNDQTAFDPRIAEWLEDDPNEAPDQALHVVLAAFPSIKQRQAMRLPWRTFDMNTTLKFATGAAAVVAVILGGALLLRPTASGLGAGGATPSPTTARPSATPSSAMSSPPVAGAPSDTSGWAPFSSDRYGYDIAVPPTWSATPATGDWSLETDRTNMPTYAADRFLTLDAAYQILVSAFSTLVPAGMSDEEWLAGYIAPDSSGAPTYGCTPTTQWEPVIVDGKPGLLNPDACDASQAFVFIDGRVHVFSIARGDQVPLLKDFLSTVRFRPFATTGWAPFSSDRYGYDIAYPKDWILNAGDAQWTLEADGANARSTAADWFRAKDHAVGVSAFAAPVPAGKSAEDWIAHYRALVTEPTCDPAGATTESVVVDGLPGTIMLVCSDSQAFVIHDGWASVFTVWRPDNGPRLKAFLSTVKFHPGGPGASPSTNPSP